MLFYFSGSNLSFGSTKLVALVVVLTKNQTAAKSEAYEFSYFKLTKANQFELSVIH